MGVLFSKRPILLYSYNNLVALKRFKILLKKLNTNNLYLE